MDEVGSLFLIRVCKEKTSFLAFDVQAIEQFEQILIVSSRKYSHRDIDSQAVFRKAVPVQTTGRSLSAFFSPDFRSELSEESYRFEDSYFKFARFL